MFEIINNLYTWFFKIIRENPMLAAGFGMYGVGLLTYILRDIPKSFFNFLYNNLTTTLTVSSIDEVYDNLLEWIKKNKTNSFVRAFALRNKDRRYMYNRASGESILTPGYTDIYFLEAGNFFKVSIFKEESKDSLRNKESIIIRVFNRSRKPLEELHEKFKTKTKEDNDIKILQIYEFRDDVWRLISRPYKRSLNSVILDGQTKKIIINHIDNFLSSKNWNINKGLPWKTGILLFGPPGTGKTSLIKALASNYNKNIYMLDLNTLTDKNINSALALVPEGSFVVVEDIDGIKASLSRENTDKSSQLDLSFNSLSLSGLLNALDGTCSVEGLIFIATTNHPEKLDKALVREGRIDLKICLDYFNTETFIEYMKVMFPDFTIPNSFCVKSGLSGAFIQNEILKNKNNPEKVLEAIREENIFDNLKVG